MGNRGTRKRRGEERGGCWKSWTVCGQKDQVLSLRKAESQRDKREGGAKRQPNGKITQRRGKRTGVREKGERGRTTHHRSQMDKNGAKTAQGEVKRGTPSNRDGKQTTDNGKRRGHREMRKMGREALTLLDQSTARKARYSPITPEEKESNRKLRQDGGKRQGG